MDFFKKIWNSNNREKKSAKTKQTTFFDKKVSFNNISRYKLQQLSSALSSALVAFIAKNMDPDQSDQGTL